MKSWLKKTIVSICSLAMGASMAIAVTGCIPDKHTAHVWDAGTVQTAATCTEDGVMKYTCTCGETKTEPIAATGHNLEVASETAATCIKDGQKKGVCTACGVEDVEVLHATGHDYESEVTEATCTVDGYTIYTCKNCDDEYRETGVRATGHNTTGATWVEGEGEELKDAATCTYTKVRTAECVTCNETVAQYYDVVKHEYAVEITTQPTCTTAGVKTFTCGGCGDDYTEEYVAIAMAHNFEFASETEEGGKTITTYVCEYNEAHTKQEVEFTGPVASVPAAIATQDVAIKMDAATLKMDETLRNQISGDVEMKAETLDDTTSATANMSNEDKERLADAEIFSFELTSGGAPVDFNGGKMTVTIPYSLSDGEDPDGIVIWYIDDQTGSVQEYEATYANGFATFETTHFSFYTVVRLTPAERCAKYGHAWATSVVAPTCTEEGFTLKYCNKCNTSEYSNVVAPLTHNYTSEVKAPTCTEKGHTTYTCSNCNDKYVSNYVNATAHSYVDVVTAPKCTAQGYTVHTCSVCKKGYTDTFVKALGHTYANGACTVCGAKDPSAVTDIGNFYFTLAESVLNANSFLVDMRDMDVKIELTMVQGEDEMTMVNEVALDLCEALVGYDADGNITAKGEMVESMKTTYLDADGNEITDRGMEMSTEMKFVLQGNKLYAFMEMTEDGYGEESYSYQSFTLDEEAMAMIEATLAGEEVQEVLTQAKVILSKIKNASNSPLNAAISKVVEYVYTKTETADGYTFTINYDILPELYTIVTTKTISEIYDMLFGEGAYAALGTDLVAMLDKTVGTALAEFTTEALKWGLDVEDVYALINTVMNMNTEEGTEPFDVRTIIGQMNTMTVCQLLDMAMGAEEPQKEMYVGMIQSYLGMAAEMTLVDAGTSIAEIVMSMQGQMGGNSGGVSGGVSGGEIVGGGVSNETVKPMNATATEEVEDPILAYINGFVEAFAASPVSFTTDKFGALVSVNSKLNVEDYTVSVMGYTATLNATGTMNYVINGTYTAEYGDVISEIEKGKAALAFEDGDVIPCEYRDYTIAVVDGVTYAVPEITVEDYLEYVEEGEEAEYDGQECVKVLARSYRETLVLGEDPSFSMQNSCNGWKEYSVSSQGAAEDTYVWAYIAYDNGAKMLGYEVAWEKMEDEFDSDYSESIYFYYNASEQKYVGEEPHNWKLIETKEPVECDTYGYKLYVCTVCGDHEKETLYKWHETESVYTLKEGSTTCEDGVICTYVCKVCGEETSSYETTYHNTNKVKVELTGAVCQNAAMYYRICPCGYNFSEGYDEYYEAYDEWIYHDIVDGDCLFSEMKEERIELGTLEDGRYSYCKYTYRCAVTECGYTYVKETWNEDAGQCQVKYVQQYTVGLKADSTYEKFLKTERISYSHNTTTRTYEDAQKDVTVTEWYCQDCGTVTSKSGYRYDEFGRTLRYWSYDNGKGYGYIRAYAPDCSYAEYEMNEDGSQGEWQGSGIRHTDAYQWEWWTYLSSSCTQYNLAYVECQACKDVKYNEQGAPTGHSIEYNSELETYVCRTCGLENATGVSGSFYLEDMRRYGDYRVGFYNNGNVLGEIYVVANHGPNGAGVVLDVELDVFYYQTGDSTLDVKCGTVVVDTDDMAAAIEALEASGTTVETISIVFLWGDPMSGDYNPETGFFSGTYLEEALTF